jgi:hypothetical protein
MKSRKSRNIGKVKRNSKSRKTKQSRKTRRNVGKGHPHEDLPHYHLFIKFPRGNVNEIPEKFLRSLKERNVKSVTVGDIEDYVRERFVYHDIDKSFTLFWRGKKLNNPNVKLRRITVDGQKIPLYGRDKGKEDYIIVVYNDLSDNESDNESDNDLSAAERHETVDDVSTSPSA